MAFGGQDRLPRQDQRTRRNAGRFSKNFKLIDPSGAIQINGSGQLYLKLASGEPFSQSSAGLVLVLGTNPALTKSGAALSFLIRDTSLLKDAGGAGVNLRTNPGLQIASGLGVKLRDDALVLDASGLGADLDLVDGRLTLESGVPVSVTDQSAKETVFFTPYRGNRISLLTSSIWTPRTFTELSVDVPDVNLPYDIFAEWNGAAVVLSTTNWTNSTTRATALVYSSGRLVKSGDTAKRYLGTGMASTAGNGQTSDTKKYRGLWNYYNRIQRPLYMQLADDNWFLDFSLSNVWRQWNADTTAKVEFVVGVREDALTLELKQTIYVLGLGSFVQMGIGLDTTTTSSTIFLDGSGSIAQQIISLDCLWNDVPPLGFHALNAIEQPQVDSDGAYVFNHDTSNTPSLFYDSGLWGRWSC